MTVLLYIFIGCLAVYALVLGWLAAGFARLKKTTVVNGEQCPVTIIICARNEQKYIGRCLSSILEQDYDFDKIQVLLINDASSDSTVQIAEAILSKSGINYTVISNAVQKGKKQSISYAMQFVHHDLVVTRDADTYTLSKKWLSTISACYNSNKADMVIGPVALGNNQGIMWALQAVENNILAVLAGGSAFYKKPFLCSGANLAFTKSAFQKTGGYASHMSLASGDDVLFMEDLKKTTDPKINYLKSSDAIVYTYPCYSFSTLIKQKIRWAAKFKVNKNLLNAGLAVLIFAVNLGWLFSLVYGFCQPGNNSLTLLFVTFKLAIDFLLLFLASVFISNRSLLWFSLPVGCIYPVYACIVAVSSLLVKPNWKS